MVVPAIKDPPGEEHYPAFVYYIKLFIQGIFVNAISASVIVSAFIRVEIAAVHNLCE
jgi:hypothetical protein